MEKNTELIVWAPGSGEERVERKARDPRESEKVIHRRKIPEESIQGVPYLTAVRELRSNP